MTEADHLAQERRLETRLYGLYPLRVRVKNSEGQAITSHTVADNVCSGGLYFQSPQSLPTDAASIRFNTITGRYQDRRSRPNLASRIPTLWLDGNGHPFFTRSGSFIA